MPSQPERGDAQPRKPKASGQKATARWVVESESSSVPSIRDVSSRWRLIVPLRVRVWDGECIVFSPLSGSTHVLDVVAGQLLGRMRSGVTDESELRAYLASFLEVPDDATFAAEVARILDHLDELGLVEPAD